MLGKISILTNFLNSFKIYFIRRYPTNKLPITGMIFSSIFVSYLSYRMCLNSRIKKLRTERLGELCSGKTKKCPFY